MAVCEFCQQEMLEATGCRVRVYDGFADGVLRERIPYGRERWPDDDDPGATVQRCGDCGVAPGEMHHPGCDMEQCPCCLGQAFVCACPA